MKNWILENVVNKSIQFPDSFYIPRTDERLNQSAGNSVRLHFIVLNPQPDTPRAERIWVTITQANSTSGKFKGTLETEPQYIDGLKNGDEVEFDEFNIARIFIKQTDPRWVDSFEKSALVSKLCFNKNETIRFVYRETPDRVEDSGWRLFTGHETEEYTSDHKNISIMNIGYLLDKDPSLLGPFKSTGICAFERVDYNSNWEKIEDWATDEN